MNIEPVAVIRSPWKEKFGIPRQSGMAPHTQLRVELLPALPPELLRGLEQVSHVWLLCWFHATQSQGWRATVRPPRLGGQRRLGVFATRSPHRPNPIALTLARIVAVEERALIVCEADLLDATPVLDIKPHLPWAEQPEDARCDWAPAPPARLELDWSERAREQLAAHSEPERLRALITDTLPWDPRPAAHRDAPERRYGVALLDVDVRFVIADGRVMVVEIVER